MAITATTLAAAAALNDTTLKVTSATGFAKGNLILVDSEWMTQSGDANGTLIPVGRGKQGSAQVAHNILSAVVTGLGVDAPLMASRADVPNPPRSSPVAYYGADGAIAVPLEDTIVILNKGSAGAFTLAAPSKFQDGTRLTITAGTAFAHVITATGLWADGVTGGGKNTATFAAFVGASGEFIAVNGQWATVSLKAVTVA